MSSIIWYIYEFARKTWIDGFFDAIEAYENAKDNWDDFSEDAEDGLTYGKQGSVIYIGTVDAVKDALSFPANLFVFEK